MSIRTLKLGAGERFPMVAEHIAAPADPWITAYLLYTSRRGRNAWSTMRNKAKALDAASRICRQCGLPGAVSVAEGRYPSSEDLDRLVEGLASADGSTLTTSRPYYDEFGRFLGWIGGCLYPDDRDVERGAALARFEKALARSRPRKREDISVPRYGLTEAERDAFLDAIIPDLRHPRTMAFRNYVVFLLAFMLGVRSGEILGIKVSDVEMRGHSAWLRIVKRQNDPDDPRSEPAAQKTVGRDLPLSQELCIALDRLKTERRDVRMSETHPYLIVNQSGAPLSHRGFRDIYADLRRRHPSLTTLINHVLRHDWNDRWIELVRINRWDPDEALRVRKTAMGWAENSQMPLVYGLRSQEQEEYERLIEMQRRSIVRYVR